MELFAIPLKGEEAQRWELISDDSHPLGVIVREWIPCGEQLDNWHEMLSAQYMSVNVFVDPPETAEDYLDVFERNLKKRCPGVSWRIVKGGQDDILAEWVLPYGLGQEGLIEHELFRLLWTPYGIHRIAYTRKGGLIPPQEAREWFSRLNEAEVACYSP